MCVPCPPDRRGVPGGPRRERTSLASQTKALPGATSPLLRPREQQPPARDSPAPASGPSARRALASRFPFAPGPGRASPARGSVFTLAVCAGVSAAHGDCAQGRPAGPRARSASSRVRLGGSGSGRRPPRGRVDVHTQRPSSARESHRRSLSRLRRPPSRECMQGGQQAGGPLPAEAPLASARARGLPGPGQAFPWGSLGLPMAGMVL